MNNQKTFSGVGVSGGAFVGRVKIVKNREDYKELAKENLAVLSTPEREHIHLLKRAGAIVTETGGLLGHIAKVAREDNIPFVSGVSDATKIFKDNDMVELDAGKGVIKFAE
jgi:pyruvate,water dikinase